MTTIAYDGITLASDSQATSSHIHTGDFQKIFKIKFESGACVLVAGCGDAFAISAFIAWVEDGMCEDEYPPNMDAFTGLVVSDSGAYLFCDRPHPIPVHAPFGMGSGGDFAIGAMAAGKSARDAVKVAITVDPYSGGKIKTLTLVKTPRKSKKAK